MHRNSRKEALVHLLKALGLFCCWLGQGGGQIFLIGVSGNSHTNSTQTQTDEQTQAQAQTHTLVSASVAVPNTVDATPGSVALQPLSLTATSQRNQQHVHTSNLSGAPAHEGQAGYVEASRVAKLGGTRTGGANVRLGRVPCGRAAGGKQPH
jgi:hypothetical protein